MKIHLDVSYDGSVLAMAQDVIERLERIENKVERVIRMNKDEAARLDRATNDIKARFERLIARIPVPLPPDEQAAVEEDFATLEAMGKDPDNPVPASGARRK